MSDAVTVDLAKDEAREFLEAMQREARPKTCQPLISAPVGTQVTQMLTAAEIASLTSGTHPLMYAPKWVEATEQPENPTSALDTLGHIALAAWGLVAVYWLIRELAPWL